MSRINRSTINLLRDVIAALRGVGCDITRIAHESAPQLRCRNPHVPTCTFRFGSDSPEDESPPKRGFLRAVRLALMPLATVSHAAFLLLGMVSVQPCLAERADRDKPMHVEADQVLVEDAQKVNTFTGHVQVTQGTMLIRGDRLVVTEDADGYQHGTVYGHLASYRQKREGLDEYVDGYGERIEYDARTETVDFFVNARVLRNQDEVRGEHITYDQKTDIFKVNSGGAPATASAPPKRVRAILQPKPKDGAASAVKDPLSIAPSETVAPAAQE